MRRRGYTAVMAADFAQGTVHTAQADMEAAIRAGPETFALWQGLTPLGRHEFICWVDNAAQAKTRARRIARTVEELVEGKRRPCCWAGCSHRPDKPPGKWQQAMLERAEAK